MGIFDKLLRAGEGKKQRALASLVPDINALEPEIERLSDADLRHKTVEFRQRIDRAMGDEASDDVINLDEIEAIEDDRERREARDERKAQLERA